MNRTGWLLVLLYVTSLLSGVLWYEAHYQPPVADPDPPRLIDTQRGRATPAPRDAVEVIVDTLRTRC